MTLADPQLFTEELPGVTEETLIRIGETEATVGLFIRYGLVKQIGDRYFRRPGTNPLPLIPPSAHPMIDPCSIDGLIKRGYRCLPGKTSADHMVCIGHNTYLRIRDALAEGYITAVTTPYI